MLACHLGWSRGTRESQSSNIYRKRYCRISRTRYFTEYDYSSKMMKYFCPVYGVILIASKLILYWIILFLSSRDILHGLVFICSNSNIRLLFRSSKSQLLFDPTYERLLGFFCLIKWLMLLSDIMRTVIVNMHEGPLHISKPYFFISIDLTKFLDKERSIPSSFLCNLSATSCVTFSGCSCAITISTST